MLSSESFYPLGFGTSAGSYGPKPPLKPKHIWAIRTCLQHENRVRDLAMFNLAIDSKLRGCDLIRLRVGDVVIGGTVRLRKTIVQQKAGRPVGMPLVVGGMGNFPQ